MATERHNMGTEAAQRGGNIARRSHCLKATKHAIQEHCQIMKDHPKTLILPLVTLGVLLGFGVWGSMHMVCLEERNAKDRASALALDIAAWLQSQVLAAAVPVQLLAALVNSRLPNYTAAVDIFRAVAPILLEQEPYRSSQILQLLPGGAVREVVPLAGHEQLIGLDVFSSPLPGIRDGALLTVRNRNLTLVGPMVPVQGGRSLILRTPIFVNGSAFGSGFGSGSTSAVSNSSNVTPDNKDMNNNGDDAAAFLQPNANCGDPCTFDLATGSIFWGFVSSVISVDALLQSMGLPNSSSTISRLQSLENMGYLYRVEALGRAAASEAVVAASHRPPEDPVDAIAELPNNQWLVQVSPKDGWRPVYFAGLIAAAVVVAIAIALLLFVALISSQKQQLLLRALVAENLLPDLASAQNLQDAISTTAGKRREVDTPAALLLAVLGELVEGQMPPLEDLVLIRSLLAGQRDLYAPLNVWSHIHEANLDVDVQEALALQLGTGARDYFWLQSNVSNGRDTKADDDVGGANNAFGSNIGGRASEEHLNMGSVAGAVAFILSAEAAPSRHRPRRGLGQGHWASGGGESPGLLEGRHRRHRMQQHPETHSDHPSQLPQEQQRQQQRVMIPKARHPWQQAGAGSNPYTITTSNNDYQTNNTTTSIAITFGNTTSMTIDKRLDENTTTGDNKDLRRADDKINDDVEVVSSSSNCTSSISQNNYVRLLNHCRSTSNRPAPPPAAVHLTQDAATASATTASCNTADTASSAAAAAGDANTSVAAVREVSALTAAAKRPPVIRDPSHLSFLPLPPLHCIENIANATAAAAPTTASTTAHSGNEGRVIIPQPQAAAIKCSNIQQVMTLLPAAVAAAPGLSGSTEPLAACVEKPSQVLSSMMDGEKNRSTADPAPLRKKPPQSAVQIPSPGPVTAATATAIAADTMKAVQFTAASAIIVGAPAPGFQHHDPEMALIGAILSGAGATATETATLTTDADTSVITTAGHVPDALSSSDDLPKFALPPRITTRQRQGSAAASGGISLNKAAGATLQGPPPPLRLSQPQMQQETSIPRPATAASAALQRGAPAANRLSLQVTVPSSPPIAELAATVDTTAPSACPLPPASPRAFRRLPHRHASFADLMHRLRIQDRQPPAVFSEDDIPAADATTMTVVADKRRSIFNRGLRLSNVDDAKISEVSFHHALTAVVSAGAPRAKPSMSVTGARALLISPQAFGTIGKEVNVSSSMQACSGKDTCAAGSDMGSSSSGVRNSGLAAALSFFRPKSSRMRSEVARGSTPTQGSRGSVELLNLVDPAPEDRDSASAMSSVPRSFVPVDYATVELLLDQAYSRWQFNVWALNDVSQGHALSVLGFYFIQRAGLIARFGLSPVGLARLLRRVEGGYLENPYHNAVHAADVLQTMHVLIRSAQLHVHYLDPLGLLAAYFAAIIHDYAHPGLTGDFLIAISHPLALRYNDRSPLENHHCAAAFELLSYHADLDVTAPLGQAERAAFRKMVIELVLATDMKQHFATLTHFNTVHHLSNSKSFAAINSSSGSNLLKSAPGGRLANVQLEILTADGGGGGGGCGGSAGGAPAVSANSVIGTMTAAPSEAPKPLDDSERLLSLQVLLKVADLGHLAEELDVHKRWLSALEEEFFLQGDEERQRGLPISPLFDREKQGVSKSQVGFFEFVALPLAHALTSVFPGVQPMMDCLVSNYRHWRRVDREAVVASPRNQTCAAATSSSS
ncbi:hypothetical protein VaNZ11_003086, partial [Volvox africanus]